MSRTSLRYPDINTLPKHIKIEPELFYYVCG